MKGFKVLTAAVLALGIGSVQASPVVSLSALGDLFSSVSDVTTIDFNSGCGYASCTGDFQLVLGSVGGQYAQPAGTNTTYLTVPNPVSNGTAVFSLGTIANYFGLFWGSIDSYNSIQFQNGADVVANYSGSDIVGSFANGDQLNYSSNRYINFDFGAEVFDTVLLSSTNFAFESDNHAYALVGGPQTFNAQAAPEPAAAALLLMGLFGLRRRSKAKAARA